MSYKQAPLGLQLIIRLAHIAPTKLLLSRFSQHRDHPILTSYAAGAHNALLLTKFEQPCRAASATRAGLAGDAVVWRGVLGVSGGTLTVGGVWEPTDTDALPDDSIRQQRNEFVLRSHDGWR